jgi:hypothetical protein
VAQFLAQVLGYALSAGAFARRNVILIGERSRVAGDIGDKAMRFRPNPHLRN